MFRPYLLYFWMEFDVLGLVRKPLPRAECILCAVQHASQKHYSGRRKVNKTTITKMNQPCPECFLCAACCTAHRNHRCRARSAFCARQGLSNEPKNITIGAEMKEMWTKQCLDHISFISGQDLMFLDLLKSPCRAQNAFCARCNMPRKEITPGMAR